MEYSLSHFISSTTKTQILGAFYKQCHHLDKFQIIMIPNRMQFRRFEVIAVKQKYLAHSATRYKLGQYGIMWKVLNWFVKLGKYTSLCLHNECGVPQESVLDPKLFILHLVVIYTSKILHWCYS